MHVVNGWTMCLEGRSCSENIVGNALKLVGDALRAFVVLPHNPVHGTLGEQSEVSQVRGTVHPKSECHGNDLLDFEGLVARVDCRTDGTLLISVLIVGDVLVPKRLEPFERLMRLWGAALVNLRWVELESLLGVAKALQIVNDGTAPKSVPDECLILGEVFHYFQTLEGEVQVAPMKCEIAKPSRFGAIYLDEFHGIGNAFDM